MILDVDGTLVDSNDAHARAWLEAFAEHGIRVAFDAVRRAIGMGGDKLMPIVAHVDAAVMIGDTPYDVEAALRAGIRIVGFECGGWTRADLRGAVEVYASPADLLDRYDASMFARRRGAGVRR